ncbi:MAG: STAS domain-containing protein [Elainellaceae cyanobacterium]
MVKIIQPAGILDSINGNQLRREVSDAIDAGSHMILIDCETTTFMDSSGLGALVMCLKKVREVNGRLCLCSVNAQIKMLLELTNMDNVFQILQNREEFEYGIGQPQTSTY